MQDYIIAVLCTKETNYARAFPHLLLLLLCTVCTHHVLMFVIINIFDGMIWNAPVALQAIAESKSESEIGFLIELYKIVVTDSTATFTSDDGITRVSSQLSV
jgi:hypothetical protein